MNFLGRKARMKEAARIEDRVIHREIEVTVERQWLAVTSRPWDEPRPPVACPVCGQSLPCASYPAHSVVPSAKPDIEGESR